VERDNYVDRTINPLEFFFLLKGAIFSFGKSKLYLGVGDEPFEFLPHQLSTVRQRLTVVLTGDGKRGFGSGEGAREMATTSKEGSRHANYPISIRGGSDDK